jgi:hypothetical protein
MNERFDSLEAELAALEPQPLSAELKTRIAADLARGLKTSPRHQNIMQPTPRWQIALATIAGLAACVLAAALVRHYVGNITIAGPPRNVPARDARATPLDFSFDSSLPTLWTYRRTISGSPGELDELLDKHAGSAPPSAERFVHVSTFPHTSAELESLWGEL